LLGRAGKSGAVAMDVKWLLGRAGKSGQSYAVSPFYPYYNTRCMRFKAVSATKWSIA